MATFLIVSRHSPENCPINNEIMKKITLELPEKAPSSESLQNFSMEPDIARWMAWNTSEIKLAMSLEERMRLLSKPDMDHTLKYNLSKQ